MNIEVTEESAASLADYARVPIAFEVRRVLDVEERAGGLGGLAFSERPLAVPFVKDYDAADGGPARWPGRFDVSRWGLFAARSGGRRVGGAAVAFATDGVEMLEGRADLAVLWDLRVAPGARGHGVGAALFRAADAWAAARGCRQLKVETQSVNVPACRFYARMGCLLGGSTGSRTRTSRTRRSSSGTRRSRRPEPDSGPGHREQARRRSADARADARRPTGGARPPAAPRLAVAAVAVVARHPLVGDDGRAERDLAAEDGRGHDLRQPADLPVAVAPHHL